MDGLRSIAVVVVAVTVLASAAAAAPARPLTLHLKFRESDVAVYSVATNSRYAFIEPLYPPGDGLGTLIDEQTGRHTELVRSGCWDDQLSTIAGQWLVFDCPASSGDEPAPEMYSLTSHTWTSVTPNPSLVGYCSTESCVRPVSAGSAWLEYAVSNCPDGEHCTGDNEFQSLASGELRSDPTGGRTVADVNYPALARRLCDPVRVPAEWYLFSGFGPGSLVMDGRFAIGWGGDENGPRAYLEECGARLDRLVTRGPDVGAPLAVGWNRTTVVWQSAPHELSGLFLPSLRRFRVSFPSSVTSGACWSPSDCFGKIALTGRTLYLLGSAGALWTANAPHPPAEKRPR
jgi:hypothetical protein